MSFPGFFFSFKKNDFTCQCLTVKGFYMNKNQIPSFLKICNMETWDPHPRRETREGAQFRHHNHAQILHNPYMTLSFIHTSHLTPALAFKQYTKSSPNFLIAQNRGPGDFRGRDQCHKTRLLKKWVSIPSLLVARPRQLIIIYSPRQSWPVFKELGT